MDPRLNTSSFKKITHGVGTVCFVLGLLLNERLLAYWFSQNGTIAGQNLTLIRFFDLFMIGLGLFYWLVRPGLAIQVSLVLGGIVMACGLSELYLRHRDRMTVADLRIADPYLHHTLRANVTAKSLWGSRWTTYHTNSLGYRDARQRVISQEPSGVRVVILGDSFTEGSGVEYADTFSARVGTLWQKKNGVPIEVLNAGVSSYCPSLEFRKLSQFLERGYTTDVVILMLDTSDVFDEAKSKYNFTTHQDRRLGEVLRPHFLSLFSYLHRSPPHTEDYDLWKYPPERGRWIESDAAYEEWGRQGVALCQQNIQALSQLCQTHHIKFYLVIYPWPRQLQLRAEPSRLETLFIPFAHQQRIPLINLYPDFLALKDWKPFYITGDVHWNEKGHAFVAQKLFEQVAVPLRGSR